MGKGVIQMTKNDIKNNWLRLNIQEFADDPVGAEGAEGGTDPETPPEEKETFTQSEVDSQISKAVNSALTKRDEKHQAELQKAIDDAIAEKERLSKLSEKERKDEELTQREQEIANRLAEIERKELKSEAVEDLQGKNLPTDFADFLLADNAENTLKNINDFKTAFDNAVNAAVKEKLRQETPSTGGGLLGGKEVSVAELAQEHRLIK